MAEASKGKGTEPLWAEPLRADEMVPYLILDAADRLVANCGTARFSREQSEVNAVSLVRRANAYPLLLAEMRLAATCSPRDWLAAQLRLTEVIAAAENGKLAG